MPRKNILAPKCKCFTLPNSLCEPFQKKKILSQEIDEMEKTAEREGRSPSKQSTSIICPLTSSISGSRASGRHRAFWWKAKAARYNIGPFSLPVSLV